MRLGLCLMVLLELGCLSTEASDPVPTLNGSAASWDPVPTLNGSAASWDPVPTLNGSAAAWDPVPTLNGSAAAWDPVPTLNGSAAAWNPVPTLNGSAAAWDPVPTLNGSAAAWDPVPTLNGSAAAWDPVPTLNGSAAAWNPVPTLNGSAAAWDPVPTLNGSAETLEDVEENLVEEGDMIVMEDRNAANLLWSNAIVPYEISPNMGRVAEIRRAFRMISASTCIRFIVHKNELNYISIKDGKGCASFVGMVGGHQPVYFAPSCSTGNLAHELIHALGLYHEHNRNDRDKYVTINWSSIIPSKKGNFKVKRGNTLNQPYDYESIMHYGTSYFSVNGKPTIVPKNKPKTIGQRSHLSRTDIVKLKALYRC